MSIRNIKIPMLQEKSTVVSLSFLNGDTSVIIQPVLAPLPKQLDAYQIAIVWASLCFREFLATFSALLLNSRLGGDIFIAGPVVTMYVNLVFRRPLINPFITSLACWSAGDWKKANVCGIPNYDKVSKLEMFIFWTLLIVSQLLGAFTAAMFKSMSTSIMGDEFVRNAAWGTRAMYLKNGQCWNTTEEFPIRNTAFLKDKCISDIHETWWFMEDCIASVFLIVAYVHIWRWLRWDDMESKNPNDNSVRYWEKITKFSLASATINLMNTMAFPTAHAGWHTSLYMFVYQSQRPDLTLTSLDEIIYRGFGGFAGCLMAIVYERTIYSIDEYPRSPLTSFLHLIIYGRDTCEKDLKTSQKGGN